MPVYTFKCNSCEYEYDLRQGFNEADPTTCPNCKKASLHRVYKPIPVVFKGSGFYATDNKSSSRVQNGVTKTEKSESDNSSTAEPKKEKKDKEKAEPKKTDN